MDANRRLAAIRRRLLLTLEQDLRGVAALPPGSPDQNELAVRMAVHTREACRHIDKAIGLLDSIIDFDLVTD
jgi:hypothetical protein